METGEKLVARAKTVIIATGGAGRMHYQGFPTSNHYGATADGLVLGYGDENQTQLAEEIATEPLKEETAKPVEEAPAEPEIPEKPVYAKRLDVSEEKTEPVKAEAPVKAPVEDTEVSDDRMSEIDRLLKELEDKK